MNNSTVTYYTARFIVGRPKGAHLHPESQGWTGYAEPAGSFSSQGDEKSYVNPGVQNIWYAEVEFPEQSVETP